MKDLLNLKDLKRSGGRKQMKIHEKAHGMIAKGFKTEELTDDEIVGVAAKYEDLSVRVAMGGNVLIRSKKDSWLAQDEGRFIVLYHKVISFQRGKVVDTYHIQDVFYDFDFLFASIISHDEYKIKGIKRSTDEIEEIVSKNTAQKLVKENY